jgi:hypothetical protein
VFPLALGRLGSQRRQAPVPGCACGVGAAPSPTLVCVCPHALTVRMELPHGLRASGWGLWGWCAHLPGMHQRGCVVGLYTLRCCPACPAACPPMGPACVLYYHFAQLVWCCASFKPALCVVGAGVGAWGCTPTLGKKRRQGSRPPVTVTRSPSPLSRPCFCGCLRVAHAGLVMGLVVWVGVGRWPAMSGAARPAGPRWS